MPFHVSSGFVSKNTTGAKVTFTDGSIFERHVYYVGESFEFKPGDVCIIEPRSTRKQINKNRLKNAGRVCKLTGTYRHTSSTDKLTAKVDFLDDDGGWAFIEYIEDLKPYSE